MFTSLVKSRGRGDRQQSRLLYSMSFINLEHGTCNIDVGEGDPRNGYGKKRKEREKKGEERERKERIKREK